MPLSDKKKASNAKWNKENTKLVSIRMGIDFYESMMRYVTFSGKSTSKYILDAVIAQIEKDKEIYE